MTAALDPQIQLILDAAQQSGAPGLHTVSPVDARALYRAGAALFASTPERAVTVDELICPGPAGPIPLRRYRPTEDPSASLATLIFFHGGGWTFGDLDSHDHICRHLCAEAQVMVVSVDYRLAPEHKFPAAVDDALAVTRWIASNSAAMGADGARLAVGGDSAGGNLAAVTALQARDKGGPDLAFQLLIYPATDMTMDHESHTTFATGYRLTRPVMAWSLTNYLRDGTDMLDPLASPILAGDHSKLPPALVMTAGYDPLRDEGKAYADVLFAAGVDVEYRCYDTMIHGFVGMTGAVDVARQALADAAQALRKALA